MTPSASTRAPWTPYKIPKTPNVTTKSWGAPVGEGDPYVLSPKEGALESKNPSSQMEWNQVPINDIITRIQQIETRLDAASIEAQCADGDVTVTLNL